MSLNRKPLFAVLAIIVMVVAALSFASSAQAATGEGPGTVCPTSVNGAGDVLVDGVELSVLAGDFVTSDPILVDEDVEILCIGDAAQGIAFAGFGGMVDYVSFSGTSGTDSFIVGATDGDKYYSTKVSVEIQAITLSKPVLKRKLVVKKGKVAQKAAVNFKNTSDYKMVAMYGDFQQESPDNIRRIGIGKTGTVKTKRARLDFSLLVLHGEHEVFVTMGSINTKNGKVRMMSDAAYKTSARRATW